jgi:TRAP-type C4-dicarboxylate transport system permease small subunit
VFRRLHQIEDAFLATLALLLVGLAGLQIAARWHIVAQFLPDGGLPWADSVLKSTVLWLAMLGALTAARDDKHLGMDALLHVLPPWGKKIARTLTLIFAGLVCAYVAYYGYQYVLLERESPSDANSFIPGWIVAVIFPFAFSGMALRFLLHALNAIRTNHAPVASSAEGFK